MKKFSIALVILMLFTIASEAALAGPSQIERAWQKSTKVAPPQITHRVEPQKTHFSRHASPPRNYRDRQALHAWNKIETKQSGGKARKHQFIKRGLHSQEELARYVANVRRNYDDIRILNSPMTSTPRIAYMKFDSGSSKKGIIVIDNPADSLNGGTIINSSDVVKRFKDL